MRRANRFGGAGGTAGPPGPSVSSLLQSPGVLLVDPLHPDVQAPGGANPLLPFTDWQDAINVVTPGQQTTIFVRGPVGFGITTKVENIVIPANSNIEFAALGTAIYMLDGTVTIEIESPVATASTIVVFRQIQVGSFASSGNISIVAGAAGGVPRLTIIQFEGTASGTADHWGTFTETAVAPIGSLVAFQRANNVGVFNAPSFNLLTDQSRFTTGAVTARNLGRTHNASFGGTLTFGSQLSNEVIRESLFLAAVTVNVGTVLLADSFSAESLLVAPVNVRVNVAGLSGGDPQIFTGVVNPLSPHQTNVIIDATAGNAAVQLPDSILVPSGTMFRFHRPDVTVNTATITPFGTDTIGGVAASEFLEEFIMLILDGANWVPFLSDVDAPTLQDAYDAGNTIDTAGGSPVQINTEDAGIKLYDGAGFGGTAATIQHTVANGLVINNIGDSILVQTTTPAGFITIDADDRISIEAAREVNIDSSSPVGSAGIDMDTLPAASEVASAPITMNTGAGGATAGVAPGGVSGAISLTTGTGGAGDVGQVAGAGGQVTIQAGSAGANGGAGGADGGSILIDAGNCTGTGNAGAVTITSGDRGTSTFGGTVSIDTGTGGTQANPTIINIGAANAKDINIGGIGIVDTIDIAATLGIISTLTLDSTGTSSAAMQFNATAGSLDINALNFDFDASASSRFSTAGAGAGGLNLLNTTGAAAQVNLLTLNGEIDLTAGGAGGIIDISASQNVDIDAVTGATINTTGASADIALATAGATADISLITTTGAVTITGGGVADGNVVVTAANFATVQAADNVNITSGTDGTGDVITTCADGSLIRLNPGITGGGKSNSFVTVVEPTGGGPIFAAHVNMLGDYRQNGRIHFHENFIGGPNALVWVNSGTGSVATAARTGAPVEIVTGAVVNNAHRLETVTNHNFVDIDGEPQFTTICRLDSTADILVEIGVGLAAAGAENLGADFSKFIYEAGASLNWLCQTGGTATGVSAFIDSGVPADTSPHEFTILELAGEVHFYIDGVGPLTSISTDFPNSNILRRPVYYVQTLVAATKTMNVYDSEVWVRAS